MTVQIILQTSELKTYLSCQARRQRHSQRSDKTSVWSGSAATHKTLSYYDYKTFRHRKHTHTNTHQCEGEGEVGEILRQHQRGDRDPTRPRGCGSVGLQVHDLADHLGRVRSKVSSGQTRDSSRKCVCACITWFSALERCVMLSCSPISASRQAVPLRLVRV